MTPNLKHIFTIPDMVCYLLITIVTLQGKTEYKKQNTMSNGFFRVPTITNEPVKAYAPGSKERESLLNTYKKMYGEEIDIPFHIGGKDIKTGDTETIHPPHDHKHTVGKYHRAEKKHVEDAVKAALKAREKWAKTPWQSRAAVFLKAADLLAGPFRDRMNAATMIGQSKNVMQAEIDAACEMVDFLKFNAAFMMDIYDNQPISDKGIWNRMEYRPSKALSMPLHPLILPLLRQICPQHRHLWAMWPFGSPHLHKCIPPM